MRRCDGGCDGGEAKFKIPTHYYYFMTGGAAASARRGGGRLGGRRGEQK